MIWYVDPTPSLSGLWAWGWLRTLTTAWLSAPCLWAADQCKKRRKRRPTNKQSWHGLPTQMPKVSTQMYGVPSQTPKMPMPTQMPKVSTPMHGLPTPRHGLPNQMPTCQMSTQMPNTMIYYLPQVGKIPIENKTQTNIFEWVIVCKICWSSSDRIVPISIHTFSSQSRTN